MYSVEDRIGYYYGEELNAGTITRIEHGNVWAIWDNDGEEGWMPINTVFLLHGRCLMEDA